METKYMTLQDLVDFFKLKDICEVDDFLKYTKKIKYEDKKDIIYKMINNEQIEEMEIKKAFGKYKLKKGKSQFEFIMGFIQLTYSFIDLEREEALFHFTDLTEIERQRILDYKYTVIFE